MKSQVSESWPHGGTLFTRPLKGADSGRHVTANPDEIHGGFSRLDLLAVTSCIVALAVIFSPLYHSFVLDNRMSSATSTLRGDFQQARLLASKFDESVTICPAASDSRCGGENVSWTEGWLIFSDSNADGVLDPGESLIKSRAGRDASVTISAGRQLQGAVLFSAGGQVSVVGRETERTLSFCDERGQGHGQQMVLLPSGELESLRGRGSCGEPTSISRVL